MKSVCSSIIVVVLLATGSWVLAQPSKPAQPAGNSGSVSFFKDVRPVLNAHCHDCHNINRRGGNYMLAPYAKLMTAGKSGKQPVVAGKPDDSFLVQQIRVTSGHAAMPKDKPPLSAHHIALIEQWVSEGATDDSTYHVAARGSAGSSRAAFGRNLRQRVMQPYRGAHRSLRTVRSYGVRGMRQNVTRHVHVRHYERRVHPHVQRHVHRAVQHGRHGRRR